MNRTTHPVTRGFRIPGAAAVFAAMMLYLAPMALRPSIAMAQSATQPASRDEELQRMQAELDRMRQELERMKSQGGQPSQPRPPQDPSVSPTPRPPDPTSTPTPRVATRGQRPPLRKTQPPVNGVTDQQIDLAIRNGVDFLLAQFDDRGQLSNSLPADPERARQMAAADQTMEAGRHALMVYALLQAGQAIQDDRLSIKGPRMRLLIEVMKRNSADGHAGTYMRGIRATALAIHDRPEDRRRLMEDVFFLIDNVHGGAYTYGKFPTPPDPSVPPPPPEDKTKRYGDNSNSQYGLLGVWSGAEVGIEVPLWYWQMVQSHWMESQFEDGQWPYSFDQPAPGAPAAILDNYKGRYTMTMAGLASLFVTYDYLVPPGSGREVGRPPLNEALARGLHWMESGDNSLAKDCYWYAMYGLERVGLACGYKYFGQYDWYRDSAARLSPQMANPLQAGADTQTVAGWVLFLSRGRHPVLLNKLRFDGFWANRPRDAANLARFAADALERPLNWQVVPIQRDWPDWMDSPILYLASHEAPKLSNNDLAKIKGFVDAGGLLYAQSDDARPAFSRFIVEMAQKLYPAYEFRELPTSHDIYTLNLKPTPRPRVRCLSNGSRILIIHSIEDLAQFWQTRAHKTKRHAFEFGVNLFCFAAGKADLRNRLASPYLPAPSEPPSAVLPVARLQYAGNWDPEPYAFVRFGRWFQYQTGLSIQATPLAITKLDIERHPIAHLTGNAPFTFTDADLTALSKYVEGGGILVADACGSSPDFDASFHKAIAKAFPAGKLTVLTKSHPLLSGGADGLENVSRPILRPYTVQKLGRGAARVLTFQAGKGHVVYSPLDITTGLLSSHQWTLQGYEPDYAQRLLKNIILWAW